MKATFAIAIATCLLATDAASASATFYADALIKDVPHVQQRPDFCGEACAEMVLRKLRKRGDQNYVFNMSGLDPQQGRGCHSADLARALRRIGFKTGDVFFRIDAARADEQILSQWKQVHADLLHGIPSIVCMHYDSSPDTTEHMRLVVGYQANVDSVVYLDPADAHGGYRRMKRATFLALWPLKYERTRWLIVRFRMQPAQIDDSPPKSGLTSADYVQRVIALKKILPSGFSLFIERPFIVVGDGPPDDVKSICQHTVKWAVAHLEREYFQHDPNEIITIWLFKDDASYRRYARSIFNDEPDTPYGYYSAAHRALIMNIATGTGTLVHEIVHPFVRANFPKCPAWLNEGLGSLYEQCGERDGHIVGYTNWRLRGLQRAIKSGNVPSFEELTETTDGQFYGDNAGTNYAQARYLCYYLQEQGKLTQFYHEFVANQTDDPTGYKTLTHVLAENDMDAFQKQWERFVMNLRE
ncbi:MAG TPA: C39 family peptidase [Lacipirellulaceae bacterium]|nr:C39 family peptidase [Lacipirellulaceae bacterium]